MHKALVVGGVESVVKRTIAKHLLDYGVELTHHWGIDGGKKILRPNLPPDIDTCVLLVDMAPREGLVPALKEMCDKRKVILVAAQRKLPQLDRALLLAGFIRKRKAPPVLEEVELDTSYADADVEYAEEPSAPVEAVSIPVPEPVVPPEPPKEEPMSKPAIVAVPPEKANWTFDDLLGHLKATLKLMRDQHGVDEVLYSRQSGLEITRRQVVNVNMD